MTNLCSNKKTNKENDDSDDSESSSDEEHEDDKPELEAAHVVHQGTVNRVRVSTQNYASFIDKPEFSAYLVEVTFVSSF